MSRKKEPDGLELPELLDVGEVAWWLRTTKKAVYAAASRGHIPGIVRIRNRLLFERAVLVRWIREKRASSPEGAGE